MKVEVMIPEVGESVQEAVLAQWYKRDGEPVQRDEALFIIETDKVTLEVVAPASGVLRIEVAEGTTVKAGTVVATIDTETAPSAREEKPTGKGEPDRVRKKGSEETEAGEPETKGAPAPAKEEEKPAAKGEPEAAEVPAADGDGEEEKRKVPPQEAEPRPGIVPPSVRRLAAEKQVDLAQVAGTGPGGRITRGDILTAWEKRAARPAAESRGPGQAAPRQEERTTEGPAPAGEIVEKTGPAEEGRGREAPPESEATTRKPMSPIRKRIAERLLQARQQTAMVTTFNEIDMGHVQAVRAELKEPFQAAHGVSLGIVSFFIKAAVEALQEYPEVNASLDGNDIVYHHYRHIGVAMGAKRGLVVPVIRHADKLSFAEIEAAIADYVEKIEKNRLEVSDLEGGTFTISNGGIYGSLLSTPLLNPPQSAILGLHRIEDRPVAVGGQVAIRPMMYVALSYDHRIIDGREGVSFLKRIKEFVENPERIMLEI